MKEIPVGIKAASGILIFTGAILGIYFNFIAWQIFLTGVAIMIMIRGYEK